MANIQVIDFIGVHAIANPISPVRLRVAPPKYMNAIKDLNLLHHPELMHAKPANLENLSPATGK